MYVNAKSLAADFASLHKHNPRRINSGVIHRKCVHNIANVLKDGETIEFKKSNLVVKLKAMK